MQVHGHRSATQVAKHMFDHGIMVHTRIRFFDNPLLGGEDGGWGRGELIHQLTLYERSRTFLLWLFSFFPDSLCLRASPRSCRSQYGASTVNYLLVFLHFDPKFNNSLYKMHPFIALIITIQADASLPFEATPLGPFIPELTFLSIFHMPTQEARQNGNITCPLEAMEPLINSFYQTEMNLADI